MSIEDEIREGVKKGIEDADSRRQWDARMAETRQWNARMDAQDRLIAMENRRRAAEKEILRLQQKYGNGFTDDELTIMEAAFNKSELVVQEKYDSGIDILRKHFDEPSLSEEELFENLEYIEKSNRNEIGGAGPWLGVAAGIAAIIAGFHTGHWFFGIVTGVLLFFSFAISFSILLNIPMNRKPIRSAISKGMGVVSPLILLSVFVWILYVKGDEDSGILGFGLFGSFIIMIVGEFVLLMIASVISPSPNTKVPAGFPKLSDMRQAKDAIAKFKAARQEQTEIKSPNPAADFTVDVTRDGQGAIITGYTGTRPDVVIPAQIEGLPVREIRGFQNKGDITSVTIPNGVTLIDNKAFRLCTGLVSVSIPGSVTEISSEAFSGCISLTSVNIPNGVTEISSEAFSGCISLTSVSIPNSVRSIGDGAFFKCGCLKSVSIPGAVRSIGDGVFSGCSNLTSVSIPDSVKSIGKHAFDDCNFTSVSIPDGVTEIDECAFIGCRSLASVTIPGSVKSIGKNAFDKCSNLTSVTISGGVTSIDDCAFSGCTSLASVSIPGSVTKIGSSAFDGCKNLATVSLDTTADERILFDGDTFFGCEKLNLQQQAALRQAGYAGKF